MLEKDKLIECLRATSGFSKAVKNEGITLGIKTPSPILASKLHEDDEDEFDDDQFHGDESDGDGEGEGDAPLAVVDTDATKEDETGKPTDYIGKFVCVCPICLNPLFSDKSEGEIYCPICDQDVEIEAAAGKVVDPSEGEPIASAEEGGEPDATAEDEFADEGEGASLDDPEDPDKEESLRKECDATPQKKKAVNESGEELRPSQITKEQWESGDYYPIPKDEDIPFLWDAGVTIEGDFLVAYGNLAAGGPGDPSCEMKIPVSILDKYFDVEQTDGFDESLQAPPSTKPYDQYTAADLDAERCGGKPDEIIAQYKAGKISNKNFTQYIAEDKRPKMESGRPDDEDEGDYNEDIWSSPALRIIKGRISSGQSKSAEEIVDSCYDELEDEGIFKEYRRRDVIALAKELIGESLKKESVDISVCPEGSVTVTDTEAEATVTVAPKEEAAPQAPTSPVCQGPECDPAPVDCPPDEECEVNDFDTDTFDGEVTDTLSDVVDDEDFSYESKSVVRKGKGLVVEGIAKIHGNSRRLRFTCESTMKKKNVFKVEGLPNIRGKITVESKFYNRSAKLITESLSYKLMANKDGKMVVLKK